MPREFTDDPIDRYILEEEGDVTEIYFIMHGQWAICFDSFAVKWDLNSFSFEPEDEEMKGKPDMSRKGILIATKKIGYGYIGDYYVLASKRS